MKALCLLFLHLCLFKENKRLELSLQVGHVRKVKKEIFRDEGHLNKCAQLSLIVKSKYHFLVLTALILHEKANKYLKFFRSAQDLKMIFTNSISLFIRYKKFLSFPG